MPATRATNSHRADRVNARPDTGAALTRRVMGPPPGTRLPYPRVLRRSEGTNDGHGHGGAGPWTGDRPNTIYVGDGRSDFCVSGRVDLLFAKGVLAVYAEARGQAFHPFETFHDVTGALARLTGELPAGLDRAASL